MVLLTVIVVRMLGEVNIVGDEVVGEAVGEVVGQVVAVDKALGSSLKVNSEECSKNNCCCYSSHIFVETKTALNGQLRDLYD